MIFQAGRPKKNMKKYENWLQKNFLGWKITFPGSVFYAGNDGDTNFAQKLVKWLRINIFDQEKNQNKKTERRLVIKFGSFWLFQKGLDKVCWLGSLSRPGGDKEPGRTASSFWNSESGEDKKY